MARQHADRQHLTQPLLGRGPARQRPVHVIAFSKPKAGAELSDIARYVFEKYVKRKFVKDRDQPDPLTLYKQGKYSPSKNQPQRQA